MKNYNFRNLVFEGGGVRAIAYSGALQVIDEMGILQNIVRVGGSSSGAINACLLAIGYDYNEINEMISGTDFKDFEDDSFLPVNFFRFFRQYGWFKGDAFKNWIGEKIKDKTGKEKFTFKELDEAVKKGGNRFKYLYIVGTDLSNRKAIMFSNENYPITPIRDAVRISMGIPFFFRSVKAYNNIMCDGGVSWNYPINLFDFKRYLDKAANGKSVEYNDNPDYIFNYETLGFRLDSAKEIEFYRDNWGMPPINIKNVKDYSVALLSFMYEMANKHHLHNNDWNRTIFIDTKDINPTEFSLSKEDKESLIESGRRGVKEYFKWRYSDPHWGTFPK